MRVLTLGALRRVGGPQDLPSSQSALAALRGEPGALGKVMLTTLLRTLLIAPGMWLAGGRGVRLWMGASAASSTITLFLLFWYAAQEDGRREAATGPRLADPIIDNTVGDTTVAGG